MSGSLSRAVARSGLPLLSPAVALLLVVFVLPVAWMVPMSLSPYQPGKGIQPGWTAAHYGKLLTDTFYLEILGRTILLGVLVTGITLVLGYPVAYALARSRSRFRYWLVILVVFPLLLNLVVRSFGWIVLLANRGLINDTLLALGWIEAPIKLLFNFVGLLIGLTHIMLPFMVLVLSSAIQNIDTDLEDAAGVLGANRAVVFFQVTLPLSLPGLLAGSVLVFVLTISAFVTPKLLGGTTYKVMSTLLYDEFLALLNWPFGSAMAFLLTAVVLLLIGLSGALATRRETGV